MHLTVVHSSCLGQHRGMSGCWLYADHDLFGHEQAKLSIPENLREFINPREFQSLAMELRAKFIEWVDDNLDRRPPEEWLTTALDKNPFSSNLFLHVCWLVAIDRHWRSDPVDLLVITRSIGLVQALEQYCLSRHISFEAIGSVRFWGSHVLGCMKSVALAGYDIAMLAYRIVLARLILGKQYKRRLKNVDGLIDTFVHATSLSHNGAFHDNYFPGLIEWHAARGIKVASYPFLYQVPFRALSLVFSQMKRSATLFAPFELFAGMSDLLHAAVKCVIFAVSPLNLAKDFFLGIHVKSLVTFQNVRASLRGIVPIVLMRVPRRLWSSGIRPKWLIEWYENQFIDKANAIGFSKADSCQVFAVRQYPPSPGFLSLYTSTAEVTNGISPAENWVCGSAEKRLMAIYDFVGSYQIAPALRYSRLYQTKACAEDERTLLIALTHSLDESVGVLNCVVPVLPEVGAFFKAILIKAHPNMGNDAIRRVAYQRWPELRYLRDLCWTDSVLEDIFPATRMVVTAGSGASLQAVCFGVPVVVTGRCAGLNLNPLEAVDTRLWELVYDADDLLNVMRRWSPHHPVNRAERISIGAQIRRDYFEPITEETMRAFLPERWGQKPNLNAGPVP